MLSWELQTLTPSKKKPIKEKEKANNHPPRERPNVYIIGRTYWRLGPQELDPTPSRAEKSNQRGSVVSETEPPHLPPPSWRPREPCLARSPRNTQASPLPFLGLRFVCCKVRGLILSLGGFLTKISMSPRGWGGEVLLVPQRAAWPLRGKKGL